MRSHLYTKTVDGTTTTYGYDSADQLTSESRSGYSASYTYDANGNRATKTLGGTTDTYHNNDVDELTSITQGASTIKSYSYDDAGRATAVTVGANTTNLDYDYEGRLTTITYPSTATNTFTYNALDARVGKVDSGGTFTFKRSGAGATSLVLSDGAAAYTPCISERRSSATKYYCQDNVGSVSRIVNSSQTTTDTRQFDAFGLLVASSGSTPTPFGFIGTWRYQEDADSGLKLLGHRYYDPSIGRFLMRDPAKHGRNWYSYCANSPTKFLDPSGLKMIGAVGVCLGIGAEEGDGDWTHGIGDEGGSTGFWGALGRDGLMEGSAGLADMDGVGTVVGGGTTAVEGEMALGEGLLVVGGAKRRYQDVMDGNDDALGNSDYNPWTKRHPSGGGGE